MQMELDGDLLMASIQAAATRRGLCVGYMELIEKWTVTDPSAGGKLVGAHERLEKIFDVLDPFPHVDVLPAAFATTCPGKQPTTIRQALQPETQ